MHNVLRRVAVDVAWAVWRSGVEFVCENPADRNDESQPHVYWPERAGHASLFATPEMQELAQAAGAHRITAPFCAFGAE